MNSLFGSSFGGASKSQSRLASIPRPSESGTSKSQGQFSYYSNKFRHERGETFSYRKTQEHPCLTQIGEDSEKKSTDERKYERPTQNDDSIEYTQKNWRNDNPFFTSTQRCEQESD